MLVQSDLPTTSYTATLASGITYHWKIVAKDNHGAATAGPVWEFTTTSDNQHPDTPANPSPAHQAMGVSLTPTFRWTGGDPDGDGFVATVRGGTTGMDVWCSVANGYQCTATVALTPNTLYHWQVQILDEHGLGATGPIWEFTTGDGTSTAHKIFLPLTLK
jgi:hypothetical protein